MCVQSVMSNHHQSLHFINGKERKNCLKKTAKQEKKEVDEDIGDLHSKSTSCLRE